MPNVPTLRLLRRTIHMLLRSTILCHNPCAKHHISHLFRTNSTWTSKNMLQTTDQSLITTASNFPKCRNPLVWCRSCPRLPVLLRQTPQLHNDKRVSKGRPWLDKGNDTVIWPTYLGKTLTFLRTIVPNWFQHLFETLKACCKGLIGKI